MWTNILNFLLGLFDNGHAAYSAQTEAVDEIPEQEYGPQIITPSVVEPVEFEPSEETGMPEEHGPPEHAGRPDGMIPPAFVAGLPAILLESLPAELCDLPEPAEGPEDFLF